jgi:uncharacterized protein (DUF58 family)
MDSSRAEAEVLAGALPGVMLEARRLAAAAPGVHGRRRAGPGEAFWQFRDHRPEDGARLVDWRRSARGERLYVREREREASQTLLFWVDPSEGFGWSSSQDWPSKRRRAITIALALSILAVRGGERVGVLGAGQPRHGARAIEHLAAALTPPPPGPPATPRRGVLVYLNDFYEPVEDWAARLKAASAAGARGAVLMICDPAEEDFPFTGRTLFTEPGAELRALFGRAEAAREEYTARLAAHRAHLRSMALAFGFTPILHRTDRSAAPALSLLVAALEDRR